MFRIPIIFIFLLLLTSPAHTQWTDWERLPGPTGGMINSVAWVAGDILAAPNGGAFYHSIDGGVSWDFLFEAAWTRSTQRLHGTIDSMVYALGYSGSYRSSDRGQSWEKCTPGGMALYACSDDEGTVLFGMRGEIAWSSDQGATWTRSTPLPGGTRDYKVAMDAHNRWYAGAYQVGVFRSTDRGQSWESIEAGLPSNTVYSLSTTAVGGLYVGLNNATFLSTDFGSTWVEIEEFRGGNTFDIQQAGNGVLIAITSEGIFRSTDWGANWTGDATLRSTRIFARDDGTVLLSSAGRVQRSTDGGMTFAVSDAGLFVQNITAITSMESGSMLVGCESGGLYFSPDMGETWEFVDTPAGWGYSVRRIESLHAENDDLFANVLTDGAFLQHHPGAAEWTVLVDSAGGEPFLDFWGTRIMRTVTTDGRVRENTNFGIGAWEEHGRIQPASGNINAARLILAARSDPQENVWLCATDRGLYQGTHDGSEWDLVLVDGLPTWLTDIAFHVTMTPHSQLRHDLFACSTDRLYSSTDGGRNWVRENLALTEPHALEFNTLGDFYFLDGDVIRFRSRSDGPTPWMEFPALPVGGAMTLAFAHRSTPHWERLLIGTRSHGILRSTSSTLAVPASQAGPSSFRISDLFPLPLSTGPLHLLIDLARAGGVRVEVCDLLGRVLQRHDRGTLPAGRHDLAISIDAHTSSMLLLRVHGSDGSAWRLLPCQPSAR